jgi:hypothetical protein
LLRDFWKSFHAAAEEPKGLKFADVIDALDEILGPHMFPEREDGGDPRRCPDLRRRPAQSQARRSSAPSSAARIIPNAATRANWDAATRTAPPNNACSASTPRAARKCR